MRSGPVSTGGKVQKVHMGELGLRLGLICWIVHLGALHESRFESLISLEGLLRQSL